EGVRRVPEPPACRAQPHLMVVGGIDGDHRRSTAGGRSSVSDSARAENDAVAEGRRTDWRPRQTWDVVDLAVAIVVAPVERLRLTIADGDARANANALSVATG